MSKPVTEEKVIIDTRDKKKIPTINLLDKKGNIIGTHNLPVGAHIMPEKADDIRPVRSLPRFRELLVK